MILLTVALAAELPQASSSSVGAEARLALEIDGDKAFLTIENLSETPLILDWEKSTITPIGGHASNLVPGGADRPDAAMLVAPTQIPAGQSVRIRPVPRAWLEDGEENDAEQWATWSEPGTVQVKLVTLDESGQLDASWTQAPPEPVALAIPVQPTSLPPDHEVRRKQREDWDIAYRRYRSQEKIARALWISGVAMGGGAGLIALTSASSATTAPDAPLDGEPSRSELQRTAAVYGVISGVGVTVALPTMVWDFSARKKRRQLGPRP